MQPQRPSSKALAVSDRSDRGTATVAVVSFVGVVLVVALAGATILGAAVAHRRAQAAADLAALSGATTRQQGGDACRAAADVARANGAVLDVCREVADDLQVTVSVALPHAVPGLGHVSARARAGPS
ncbi:hypothetical protein EPD65_06265 [Nocardioides jejuensis]|uniref:Putative Flp pilus-assembly TadG-like N-terminal domain-containing protein n=1 Tax=Nocardioides jejuensis TaxID=2502782 RepID=A0A4R1CFL5_9ACTN|nr:hypothetical protein EPD65_06265 [Nocardioides jejuensis]